MPKPEILQSTETTLTINIPQVATPKQYVTYVLLVCCKVCKFACKDVHYSKHSVWITIFDPSIQGNFKVEKRAFLFEKYLPKYNKLVVATIFNSNDPSYI